MEPILPLVKQITDIAGSFTDLPPATEEASYTYAAADVDVPEHVHLAGLRAEEAKNRKDTWWPVVEKPVIELSKGKKHERAEALTKALAWLHSRGECRNVLY